MRSKQEAGALLGRAHLIIRKEGKSVLKVTMQVPVYGKVARGDVDTLSTPAANLSACIQPSVTAESANTVLQPPHRLSNRHSDLL